MHHKDDGSIFRVNTLINKSGDQIITWYSMHQTDVLDKRCKTKRSLHTMRYYASSIFSFKQPDYVTIISIAIRVRTAGNGSLDNYLRENASFRKVFGELSMRPKEVGLSCVFFFV
jgi:hypothetical protein